MINEIKKPSVTVGIPAYNEQANIGYLIQSLLSQKETTFVTKAIIVFSDGSTDKTDQIVRSFEDPRVKLIVGTGRQGVAFGQNSIIASSDSDILILMNADIGIRDVYFAEKLIEPIINNSADLTSCKFKPIEPKTFFEKIIYQSVQLKDILFESYNNGNNLFTCHGGARALSKRFYKQLVFRSSVGEDAFTYLSCIEKQYKYAYVPGFTVDYKLPENYKDHKHQSVRFFANNQIYQDRFEKSFIQHHTQIPLGVWIKSLKKSLPIIVKHPFPVFAYMAIVLSIKLQSLWKLEINDTWSGVKSSKYLH